MGLILGVERVADRDGPGLRTVVLLKGCRLRCPWCRSPEGQRKQREVLFFAEKCDGCGACVDRCSAGALVLDAAGGRLDRRCCRSCGLCLDACPTGALQMAGQWLTAEQTVQLVEADRVRSDGAFGGVTLSGGDVTLQPAFAAEVLRVCRERGLHTALETTGFAPWSVLEPLVRLSDLVMYDVKLAHPAAHNRHLGVDNRLILENLRAVVDLGASVQARVPLIPGIADTDANLEATVSLVAGLGIRRIAFLPYRVGARERYRPLDRVYWLAHLREQAPRRLEEIRELAERRGLEAEMVDWGTGPGMEPLLAAGSV